jgi:hypothetical protein
VKLASWPFVWVVLSCAGCSSDHGGRVIDADTQAPIAGVHVTRMWFQGHFNPVHGRSPSCVHVQASVTDKEGKFWLPGWGGYSWTATDRSEQLILFHSDYVEAELPKGELLRMKKGGATLDRAWQMALRSHEMRCIDRGKELVPVLEARLEKARALPPDEKELRRLYIRGLEQYLKSIRTPS